MAILTGKHLVAALGAGLIIGGFRFGPGDGGAIEEVLGLDKEAIRDLKQDGATMEEIVTENGFDSLEAFEAAMEDAMRANLAERGLSDEVIEIRISAMQDRREIMEDVRDVRLELFGLTHDEIKALHDEGQTLEDIVKSIGYDSVDAFQTALSDKLAQLWADEGVDQATIDERIERLENRGNGLGGGLEMHERAGEGFGEGMHKRFNQ
jgi:AraC-like DNA-binding protein